MTYGISNELSGSAGNGRLLDNDGALTSILSDIGSDSLESSHISSTASTDTTVLGRGVDGNKDDIGLTDMLGNVGRKEQVGETLLKFKLALLSTRSLTVRGRLVGNLCGTSTIAGNTDNVVQTGLVDGRVEGVPATDTGGVSVDNSNLNVRVLESDNSGSWAT